MSKILRMALVALAIGAFAQPSFAQEKAAAGSDPVVARVNGTEIRRSAVMEELQAMGPQAQQMPPDMIYPQLLQRLIITQLVSSEGYKQNLQNDAEVKDRVKDAERNIVADVFVKKSVQPKITDDKIKAKYDELAKQFKPQDEVRARHILVPTEAEANEIIKQLKAGGDFAKLAEEKSKDSGSMKQGGDLGYFTKDAMVKPFADAAFGMKVGQLSDKPVKTDFGFHVIKVEDKRKTAAPPLAEVREQVRNQVGQEMAQQLVKDLEAKAKIERFNPDGSPLKKAEAPAAAPKNP